MEVIIFTGVQASGKSTFYLQEFYRTHIRINLDMLKTRHREAILFKTCLEIKQPVVIDNTNPTIEDRQKYISLATEFKFRIKGYYFESKISDALSRNKARKGKEQIPDRGVKGTYNRLEIPSYEEGFDELYFVCFGSNNDFVVKEWQK